MTSEHLAPGSEVHAAKLAAPRSYPRGSWPRSPATLDRRMNHHVLGTNHEVEITTLRNESPLSKNIGKTFLGLNDI